MPLTSRLLRGVPRLEQAASGPPPIKPLPFVDDPIGIGKIQEALIELKFLPPSFGRDLLSGEFFGLYGTQTVKAVKAFQKKSFPGSPKSWDAIIGKGTMAKLDEALDGTGDSIRIVESVTKQVNERVVDPASVAQKNPNGKGFVELRDTRAKADLIQMLIAVRRNGKRHWFGVAVPKDLKEFNKAHVFFHPNPGGAGHSDTDYYNFTGNWRSTEKYTPWLGVQMAHAGRREVLIVPFVRVADYIHTLGLLQNDPILHINEILAAVQQAVAPEVATPSLSALGISSFSFGIDCLARFVPKVLPSGLLREAVDLDGMHSSSTRKFISVIPSAAFKKYAQGGVTNPALGFFSLPKARWKTFAPGATNENLVHGQMPNLFLHAMKR